MRIRFIIIILLQALLLTGMIGYRHYWVSTGERILLKTAPVDPRDIFRGDYVHLSYDIANIDLDALAEKERFGPNDKVFAILEKEQDGSARLVSISRLQPSGGTFIQGRARNEMTVSRWEVTVKDEAGQRRLLRPRWFFGMKTGDRVLFCLNRNGDVLQHYKETDAYAPQCHQGSPLPAVIDDIKESKFTQLFVEYGIESYFVEEGKGKAIEAARNVRELKVEVSLRKDGKGIITGLLMDGKAIK